MEQRNRSGPVIQIGYCAYHGAGRLAMPRLLKEAGFTKVNIIKEGGLYDLNGLFPSFCSDPGKEHQPDPGDTRAAKIAVDALKKQYPGAFEQTDIVIGTDPDADRCGVVVKVPAAQRHLGDETVWHRAEDTAVPFGPAFHIIHQQREPLQPQTELRQHRVAMARGGIRQGRCGSHPVATGRAVPHQTNVHLHELSHLQVDLTSISYHKKTRSNLISAAWPRGTHTRGHHAADARHLIWLRASSA